MNHDQHDPYDPHDPLTEPEAADPHLDPTQGDHSRRTMVRTLLGAAAGAAVASVAAVATDHRHAQAATGTMIYGATNNSGLDTTVLRANVAGGRTLSVINFEPNGKRQWRFFRRTIPVVPPLEIVSKVTVLLITILILERKIV